MQPRSVPFLSVLLLCVPTAFGPPHLAAQGPPQPLPLDPVAEIALNEGVGLERLDGHVVGVGPRYRVQLWPDGMEFTPLLGADAPAAYPLRLRLAAVRRDGAARPLPPGELVLDGEAAAEYRRPGLVERYELRREGVEQSFVLDELPPGGGDLVITLAASTDLAVEGDARGDTLRLRAPAVGGVDIGAVTAIDARGRRAAGSLRYDGATLELVVPGAFVERAALPLLVDPLFGAAITVSNNSPAIGKVRVAFEPTTANYLVVWEADAGGSQKDIVSVRVRNGAVNGRPRLVAFGTGPRRHFGGVATVNASDAFVVVWGEDGNLSSDLVLARAIDATTGGRTGKLTVARNINFQNFDGPDVAGELTGGSDEAIVVWTQVGNSVGQRTVRVARIRVPASLSSLSASGHKSLATTGINVHPAISRSGGARGRYLVTWQTNSPSGSIRAVVLDRDLNVLTPTFLVNPTDGHGRQRPALDGDGTSWLVAYSREEIAGGGPHDLVGRRVVFDATSGTAAPEGAEAFVSRTSRSHEAGPSVARLRDSYLVAYGQGTSSVLRSVDPTACTNCELRAIVESGVSNATRDRIGVGSLLTGGLEHEGRDEGLLAWARDSAPTLKANLFRPADGLVTDLGGGCGRGGENLTTCCRAGNFSFAHRLQGTLPLRATALIVGSTRMNARCFSGCVLVPDPLVLVPAVTSNLGTARIPSSLGFAGLKGQGFLCQWATLNGLGTNCYGFDLSNALSVVIE